MGNLPKDKMLGRIAKDALGGNKLTGEIKWSKEDDFYLTDPFRFTIEKVDADESVYAHWKLYDWDNIGSYCRDTLKACKEQAQDIIDIESGKKPTPNPEKQKAVKATKYEGLFRGGQRVPPNGFHRCQDCDGRCVVDVPGEKKPQKCHNCDGDGIIRNFDNQVDDIKDMVQRKRGLFD